VLLERARSVAGWQLTLGAALFVLGFLIAAQLASEGPRIRITSQERTPLIATVLDLQKQQDDLKTQVLDLRASIADLDAAGEGGTAVTQQLNDRLEQAQEAAGLVALAGPGLVIRLSDSGVQVPTDADERDYLVSGNDVRTVVEELWLAGAEDVAVNDERVVVTTAILDIGGSVLVNSAYLAPPYQVSAIGPSDMFERLTQAVGFVDFIRSRAETYGIGVDYAVLDEVDLPAYAGSVTLRYGFVEASPSPGVTPDVVPPFGTQVP
jgi:uncharacterized protein YlxW (UPF0749 family)